MSEEKSETATEEKSETATEENAETRQPTMEEIKLIRSGMLKMCQDNYKKFINSLKELPLPQQAFMQSFLFFDTGSLWMKEAIEFAPLIQKKPESSDIPETLQ